MFSNVRIGTTIYVLHKSEAKLEIGEVTYKTEPTPMYTNTYQSGIMQPQKMYVDLDVRINGENVKFQKLQADATIADSNGMVVSESRDAILNEVLAMQKCSQSIIDSVEHHTEIVSRCNALVQELNPDAKRDAERAKEIVDLRSEVGELKNMLTQLLSKKEKEK
ncbi:MAG: hypothetical protein MJZ98_01320 [Paludibacteraceae bacterium]|nr:hypothetical protein [Paludibacteraceae bacterium]